MTLFKDFSIDPEILGGIITATFCIAFISSGLFVNWFLTWRFEARNWIAPLPSPPFNLIFGHIMGLATTMAYLPSDAHPAQMFAVFSRAYNLRAMFMVDTWPASSPKQIVVMDPDIANQVTVLNSFPKDPVNQKTIGHITGKLSMLTAEGEDWKRSRALFNPGFALSHLNTLIPGIVDDTMEFRNLLTKYAKSGEVLQVEHAAAALTIDIITHVVLDHSLHAQTTDNEFVRAFRSACNWCPNVSSLNPLKSLNPVVPFMHWYNARIMDNYLSKVIDDRYALRSTFENIGSRRGKPLIDLVLDDYITEQKAQGSTTDATDPEFKRFVIDQMKTFILAGHDTSSSTLSYVYYLLSKHPAALIKVREEYDTVFGKTVDETGDQIKNDPLILNKLVYTNAVIKEVLRLYPAASTARAGDTDIVYEGVSYPTKGHLIWIPSYIMHRREDLFPSPDEFIPERFLAAPNNWKGHEIPKDAYRPFEKGPRNCIGQEFAGMEMRIIMALTLRDFDISSAFEEYDRKLGRKDPGSILGGRRGILGDRAYQIFATTAKPVDGMPVKVKKIGT